MHEVFRRFYYVLPKKEPPDAVFARAWEVAKHYTPKLRFSFSDNVGGKISGVTRIAKHFPEIEPFIFEYVDNHNRRFLCASNMTWNMYVNPNKVTGSLDAGVVQEILRGFPRRYPLGGTTFILDGLNWGNPTSASDIVGMSDLVADEPAVTRARPFIC